MHILVLGAGGFIGRHVVARLLASGHTVTGTARRSEGLAEALPGARFLALDLAGMVDPADWRDRLAGVDVVINAAGVLRGPEMDAVHIAMPRALHAAARESGVRRIVLISAISARAEVPTDYAQSKLAGEADLRASGLGWTILRPSLVYGEGSYGGTSLLRGLAGLPFATPLPRGGDYAFSPIHVCDLAEAVEQAAIRPELAGQVLEPCGPDTLALRDLLGRYRDWLGFGRARFIPVPLAVMRMLARIGDVLGSGPVSTNSLVQLLAGNQGDGAAFARQSGTRPRGLSAALRDHPAQVQDRWHARLFFLAPAVRWILALLWLASALLGLFAGAEQTHATVQAIGLPGGWEDPLRIGASLADLGLAALVLLDRKGGWATGAQLLAVSGYTLVIGWALPGLWLDPLGPLLKNLPILVLIMVHWAVADSR